jgi:hypothetical protein
VDGDGKSDADDDLACSVHRLGGSAGPLSSRLGEALPGVSVVGGAALLERAVHSLKPGVFELMTR